MKINSEQMQDLQKLAETAEKNLANTILTKDQIDEINQQLDVIIADMDSHKRYFKRLS